ncbi:zinc-regulated GTPase metalloprotein activator 1 [Anabrus simplex]|uniref:zinc-regulated GTPase metalloprotein activator 1 n=1 Tax=Anabrus simplex TaxID=316456 RepID=UPI0035A2EFD2
MIETIRSGAALDQILDLGMYSTDTEKLAAKMKTQLQIYCPAPGHLENRAVSTCTLKFSRLYPRGFYEDFLQSLLWRKEHNIEVFRVKGLIRVQDCDVPLAVNGVYDTYELEEVRVPLEKKDSFMIFIGIDAHRIIEPFMHEDSGVSVVSPSEAAGEDDRVSGASSIEVIELD